jgi:3-deoxy-D-manno-octulosonate 8-phosphate phosphatase KdsC-like HAD superfamily phosphatase
VASQEIETLANALARLPGLGPRSARRAVLHLMKKRESTLQPLLTALQKVATWYEVPMEQVLAIGDAPNDVGMLQAAGVSVAMDNAHQLVKDVADWVAPSNNDHGVHAALARYGLC